MQDKSQLVKEVFEDISHYLTFDYNLRIRRETVSSFIGDNNYAQVLDMPCGTGDMSVPFLNRFSELTLIDIASNMLSHAESKIPSTDRARVHLVNADFFRMDLSEKKFDLVICLGLLAHVNSPEDLLAKLASIIPQGGSLIIQNTDSSHVYSHLIRAYLAVKNVLRKQPYKFNKVPAKFVEQTLLKHGFELKRTFRYNQSFLGLSNLFSNDAKYRLTRNYFGDAEHPRHQSWGSDYTYLFVKK